MDFSMLTESEIEQLRTNATVLEQGDVNVCIYLRYSSNQQTEQSIEGQLRDCIAYCKRKKYKICAIYVDRIKSASKDIDKRVNFQMMIEQSKQHRWSLVICWKLDRFARSREDSAVYKMRLRKNGVKVESATEQISDNPEGIILESVLEGVAEYFSAELAQKVTRGMRESALKCNSVGGNIPLGYKVENKKLVVDPLTAPIVKEAFERYANGESVASICKVFNSRGWKTSKGREFGKNSFRAIFRNEKYIGVNQFMDIRTENGVPAIISKDLFERVHSKLRKNALAPARGKARTEYLLSGKLFCGHCGENMNGESGKGKSGQIYHYYKCANRKRGCGCDKKAVRKDWIEEIVAQDALELLTAETIDEIANIVIRQVETEMKENTRIAALVEKQKELNRNIENIIKAIEKGIASDTLMQRLSALESEKKTADRELEHEKSGLLHIDRTQIVFWLERFKDADINNIDVRRRLIDLLINSVTVWDDPDGFKITTAYNLTSCPNHTFRIPSNHNMLGFEVFQSTKTSKFEQIYIIGSVFVQTRKHVFP